MDKRKKLIKLINLIPIILVLIILISTPTALAFDTTSYNPYSTQVSGPTQIEDLLKQVLGIVEIIAGLVATIAIIWLGVSFMKESPQGRAESKKKIYMILVGCALVFGASEIIKLVATTANAW